jgi:hypothetical protein
MAGRGPAGEEHHRRQLDLLRAAGRRARLLAQPEPSEPPLPELENARPELGIFARHLRKRLAG